MAKEESAVDAQDSLILATEIVSAFVSNNSLNADKVPAFLQEVHDAIRVLAAGGTASAGNQEPAVPIARSITPDYVICLEDGKKLKMLKRYLRTQYDMSPEDYRRKWGLPADYPMVGPELRQAALPVRQGNWPRPNRRQPETQSAGEKENARSFSQKVKKSPAVRGAFYLSGEARQRRKRI